MRTPNLILVLLASLSLPALADTQRVPLDVPAQLAQLSAEERARLRQEWQNMSPEEREQRRQQFREERREQWRDEAELRQEQRRERLEQRQRDGFGQGYEYRQQQRAPGGFGGGPGMRGGR